MELSLKSLNEGETHDMNKGNKGKVRCLLDGGQAVCSQSESLNPQGVFMEQIKSQLVTAQRLIVKVQVLEY